jgi:hypothetical protein
VRNGLCFRIVFSVKGVGGVAAVEAMSSDVLRQAYRNMRFLCCTRYRKNSNAKATEMYIQKCAFARRVPPLFFVLIRPGGDRFFFSPEVLLESLIAMLR